MWFWLWLTFVIVVLAIPAGYGWGYRGWGPPYPRAYGRRRAAVREATAAESTWGVLADILWMFAAIAIFWLLLGLFI